MDTGQVLLDSFREALVVFITPLWAIFPRIMAALIIGVVGLIFAGGLSAAARKLIDASQIDVFLKKLGVEEMLKPFNLKLHSGGFVAGVIEWLIIATALLAVFDALGLTSLNALLLQVFEFLPSVLVAAVTIVSSIVIARLASSFVGHLLSGTKVGGHSVAVGITKIGVVGFGILLALDQLGVASELIRILFAGMVFMVSLAGGLAFGLGGRDLAATILGDFKHEITRH